jgi:hypothetical protein
MEKQRKMKRVALVFFFLEVLLWEQGASREFLYRGLPQLQCRRVYSFMLALWVQIVTYSSDSPAASGV